MQYLAVRYYDDSFLFIQKRVEREIQNSVLIDEGKQIETIVMKVFDSEVEAINYCTKINNVTDLIDKIITYD